MKTTRLEAFSDGVIAIIITIMVLELKTPEGHGFGDLFHLAPIFFSYVLSFIYVGIYWNNHHHMMHLCKTITGSILWANLHLLFWLSLIPFSTAWMGESDFAILPTAIYGVTLFMTAIAYSLLQNRIIVSQGSDSILKTSIGKDWKGKASFVLYLAAILMTGWQELLSLLIYAGVALMWLVPDKRIEKHIPEDADD